MRLIVSVLTLGILSACGTPSSEPKNPQVNSEKSYYGTMEAFADKAIYFVVTDRFVNGDEANDQREQGGAHKTFDRPVPNAPEGMSANVGYLGGDFKGVLNNADYIREMGFGAVWITPIVDNPDAAFTGSKPVDFGSQWTDQGKTGYHGYWGVNFYKLDEHLPSDELDFAQFTKSMREKNLKVVLDIVGNHTNPSFTMPVPQAEFGKLYGKDGALLADHQNVRPENLDPANNPLHAFFNTKQEIAELGDLNGDNPEVMNYLVGAYEQWIDQGADAFRIDTIGWQPHQFWKTFADRIRQKRPEFFMFGEDFRWTAEEIAPHTLVKNGGISVLDFPLKKVFAEVFEHKDSDYAAITKALFLTDGPYANPYDLVTFYDNHDMPRMNASDEGFIDANNLLFTMRGIPAIYYGSETGFQRGMAEHAGNRNYFGQERVDRANEHAIYQNLKRIAQVRSTHIALQKGLQVNLHFAGDTAAFYRVYQHDGVAQLALVLLNKSDRGEKIVLSKHLQQGQWNSALDDSKLDVDAAQSVEVMVPAHGVQVYVLNSPVTHPELIAALDIAMNAKSAAVND